MAIFAGVGLSNELDSFEAGKAAARMAKKEIDNYEADLVILFSSIRFDQSKVLKGVRSVITREAPLVGCSTAGEITSLGPDKKSVVVMFLRSDTLRFTVGLGSGVSRNAREAGQVAARQTAKMSLKNRHVFMMMPDGLKGNGADIIRGVQEILGTSFPIVGGSSGDDFLFQKTLQYYNDQVLTDCVPGVLFAGDISVGIGARHGWYPIGKPRKVSKAEGNALKELDGEPAVKIYEDYFGKEAKDLRDEPLGRMAVMYPLGMSIPDEEECLVRNALRVNKDGSLICAAEVPEGSEIRLMMGSKETALIAARKAAHQALKGLEGANLRAAIIFDSVSRGKLFGRMAAREIEIIKEVLGKDVPIIGLYTYGEQAPLGATIHLGQAYFHNETVVILAIGE